MHILYDKCRALEPILAKGFLVAWDEWGSLVPLFSGFVLVICGSWVHTQCVIGRPCSPGLRGREQVLSALHGDPDTGSFTSPLVIYSLLGVKYYVKPSGCSQGLHPAWIGHSWGIRSRSPHPMQAGTTYSHFNFTVTVNKVNGRTITPSPTFLANVWFSYIGVDRNSFEKWNFYDKINFSKILSTPI